MLRVSRDGRQSTSIRAPFGILVRGEAKGHALAGAEAARVPSPAVSCAQGESSRRVRLSLCYRKGCSHDGGIIRIDT